jgi:hypothetical protein
MHNPKSVDGKHISVYQLNDFFTHVTEMLLEHFDTEDRKGTVFVLGGYVLEPVAKLRERFPGKKLIAYQLEQMMGLGNWHQTSTLIENLMGYDEVWDYDPLNVHFLGERGIKVDRFVPLLHTRSLERVISSHDPKIDVLFYGIMNERRWRILNRVQLSCYNELRLVWVYGEDEMDRYISDSKVILNIHAFEPWNRQEQVRMFYPVINGKTVVSEPSQHNQMSGLIIESGLNDMVETLRATCKTDLGRSFGPLAAREFRDRTDKFLRS